MAEDLKHAWKSYILLDIELTINTSYLALTGELWGVYCEYLEKIDIL